MKIARGVTRELVRDGAAAVVLMGSHVRGDAHAYSDIDLIAVYTRRPAVPPAPYSIRNGVLVAVAWKTLRSERVAFREPARVTTFIPGWREAVILHDPHGIAAKIKTVAERWTWDAIAEGLRHVCRAIDHGSCRGSPQARRHVGESATSTRRPRSGRSSRCGSPA